MKRALIAILLMCLVPALLAEPADEENHRRLLDAVRAQDLYLAGESAYAEHDLERAVVYLAAALELKPQSAYARVRLDTARAELYARQLECGEHYLKVKDPVSAIAALDRVAALMPESAKLSARVKELEKQLTDDQSKAIAAYREAVRALASREGVNATHAIARAHSHDPKAACIAELTTVIATLPQAIEEITAEVTGSNVGPETPAEPVRRYINAITDNDYTTAADCVSANCRQKVLDEISKRHDPQIGPFVEHKQFVLRITPGYQDKALVLEQPFPQPNQLFRLEFYAGKPIKGIPYTVVKENDTWKIDLDQPLPSEPND